MNDKWVEVGLFLATLFCLGVVLYEILRIAV